MMQEWLARQGWTDADLEANRAGRISDAQLATVRERNRSYMRRALWFTLPLPVLSLGFAIFTTVAWDIPQLFVLPILGFLAIATVLIFVGGRVRAVTADLAAGRVEIVEGKLENRFVNITSGQAVLRIGTTRIQSFGPQSDPRWKEVRRMIVDESQGHGPVRAFYLPGSKLAIAAEPFTRSSE